MREPLRDLGSSSNGLKMREEEIGINNRGAVSELDMQWEAAEKAEMTKWGRARISSVIDIFQALVIKQSCRKNFSSWHLFFFLFFFRTC